jgi:hypothetical protein
MIGAQNQAAVGGACALNVLRDLERMARRTDVPPSSTPEDGEPTATPAPIPTSKRDLVFSVTTEGPIHELWVHFIDNETYHVTSLRTWRTSRPKDAKEFVQAFAKVIEWGVYDFRRRILDSMESVHREIVRQR